MADRGLPLSARIVLVRHGQTDYNAEDRWQGSRSDVPLNEAGFEQARETAEGLARRYPDGFDALYASDLLRARQTAEVIARRFGLDVRIEPALRELDHGRWDGRTKREVVERWPEEHAAYRADPRTVRRGGGESYEDLGERVWPALERIAERHAGGRVVVVSHGGPIRLVLARVLDRPLVERDDFGVVNAATFEVERGPAGWSLVEG